MASVGSTSAEIAGIIAQLIEVHDGRPWMGSSFAKKLDAFPSEQAFVSPREQVHSVAQILAHLTFWRVEGILKIKTGTGSKTDDHPDNWPSNQCLEEKGWANIVKEHRDSLSEFMNLLAEKDDHFLDQTYYDNDFQDVYPYRFVVQGMLHHDIYHLGQLGLIMKELSN